MGGEAAVREALERVYQTFSGVPRPQCWEASPERDGKKLLRDLTAAPLQKIPGNVIGPYAGWAMTTVGGGEDYQYFLPRILELAVYENAWTGTIPPVIVSRLKMAGWAGWPAARHDAVVNVFEAAFRWTVHCHTDVNDDAPDWLCGLAMLDVPLGPLLAEWRQSAVMEAILQLAWFVMMALKDASHERLAGSFWDDAPAPVVREVADWLRSQETNQQLSAWLDRVPECDRWMLDYALLYLA